MVGAPAKPAANFAMAHALIPTLTATIVVDVASSALATQTASKAPVSPNAHRQTFFVDKPVSMQIRHPITVGHVEMPVVKALFAKKAHAKQVVATHHM
jgi:hypothetical protein